MKNKCLAALCLICIVSTGIVCSELTQSASIYYEVVNNKPSYKIILNTLDINSVAYATFSSSQAKIGWDILKITTNQQRAYEDEVLAYGAGYLEGYLTRQQILYHYKNLSEKLWGKGQTMPSRTRSYFIEHKNYIYTQYSKNMKDDYWRLVFTIFMQLEGLIQAYNDSVELYKIDYPDFFTMPSMGDLFDIVYYKSKPNFDKLTYEDVVNLAAINGHCSALIKLTADDIFFGHNTWFFYSAMNRIFKEYHFNFANPLQKAKSVMFSSYPGGISSIDDFYITDNDLVVMETTNMFYNSDLYEGLNPATLLSWERAMISNFSSVGGSEWTETYAKENSGTYNNQYMVLDLKKARNDGNGVVVDKDALWIIEQVPGYTERADVTEVLKGNGYWASYNTPYFEEIKLKSKINELLKVDKRVADVLDHETCARAAIFRRDQGNVTSLAELKKLLRYNDYKNDPLSKSNPGFTISSRFELGETSAAGKLPLCMGAYDVKASSMDKVKGIKRKTVSIIGAPSNEIQPTFAWDATDACRNEPRYGLNKEYNFDWVDYTMDSNPKI